jgi:hypothetical protein
MLAFQEQREGVHRNPGLLSPGLFYKKGSQEKTVPHRPELFLLRSPLD